MRSSTSDHTGDKTVMRPNVFARGGPVPDPSASAVRGGAHSSDKLRLASTRVGRVAVLHSLGWLVAANLAGLWMAASLQWPSLGDALAPLTFGRWAPVHMNAQLYGWCALPLVGALLAWSLDARHPQVESHARIALAAWTLALASGCVGWLGGVTSGRLFLDWHGWTRPLLPVAMHVLWALLAAHTAWRWKEFSRGEKFARSVILLPLLAVPALLYWASGREVFPAVNPDSGGATGASLLGSTLGIATIFWLLPRWLGLSVRRSVGWFWSALALGWAVFAVLDRGDASHHAAAQVAGLGTLLAWAILLPWFWGRHAWPEAARGWLLAACGWWAALLVTGWITFLPEISERLKFTHALVGHAHLAMAGLLTSVNGAILAVLAGRAPPRGVFAGWQVGCVVHVAALLALGWRESEHVAELYRSEPWTESLMAVRLLGGAAMTGASVMWLREFIRR